MRSFAKQLIIAPHRQIGHNRKAYRLCVIYVSMCLCGKDFHAMVNTKTNKTVCAFDDKRYDR